MSRYKPPKPVKQKEREDLIEKVKEMTGEETKGGKREKSVEVDTDLSWDHEGLKPLPKAPKNRLDESPKPPRVPKAPRAKTNAVETSKKECPANRVDSEEGKYPEISPTVNQGKKEVPSEKKQDPVIGKKSGKHDEKSNLESPENPADRKTARWIEEQNEFLGKQKKKGSDRDKKERDAPIFNPNGPLKFYRGKKLPTILVMRNPPPTFNGCSKGSSSTSSYGCDR